MSREWKPGDVVKWAETQTSVLVPRCANEKHAPGPHWHHSGGGWDGIHAADLRARPLLVIDPEDEETVDRVANAITGAHTHVGVRTGLDWLNLQAALHSLITPPKPEEPTGLGAVVEDVGGWRWVRSQWDFHNPWTPAEKPDLSCASDDKSRPYAKVAAVKVLSQGWVA